MRAMKSTARIAVVTCSLVVAACRSLIPALPPATPEAPKDEIEDLIARSLRQSPLSFISGEKATVLSNRTGLARLGSETSLGISFTPGALPQSRELTFILLTPEEIGQIAAGRRPFNYLAVGEIEISDGRAAIELATKWPFGFSRFDRGCYTTYEMTVVFQAKEEEWEFQDFADFSETTHCVFKSRKRAASTPRR
jgi:hypothetical protein